MKNLIQGILIVINVLLSTSGAEAVTYAQVGGTVTLKPPEGIRLQRHYLFWRFGNMELAWRNIFGGTWFSNDEKWKGALSLSEGALIIRGVKQEHFGTFSCEAKENGQTVASSTRTLLKLTVTKSPTSPLLPGETLSLFCDAEAPSGLAKPAVHWLNPQGEQKKTSQGQVKVTASGQHSGEWTCVVTNGAKEIQAKASVAVVDMSPAPLHPQYTSKSSPLSIPCSIASYTSWDQIKTKGIQGGNWHFYPASGSGVPSAAPQRLFSLSLKNPLSWKSDQDRGLTPEPGLKAGVLSLARHEGREDDSGVYVCSLTFNSNVTLRRTVNISVLQIRSSSGPDLTAGQQVNLTCSLGHPLPSGLRLKWFPPEQSHPLASDHRSTHLTVPHVGAADGGVWRCELWRNGTRLTSAKIVLKIDHTMSLWMQVIICSVAVIVVLILIFIVYRCRQRKMTHPRHRLCQCKNPKPRGFYRT
ncbi:T-cell surface glycoprotein CD4-like [Brachionichthys hirsutus]|uniref:T-cell surface glycoprotein CD4-like n=1 Tax=Brachionichthys hirsutus TaxID=412623 RepID=UPI003604D729